MGKIPVTTITVPRQKSPLDMIALLGEFAYDSGILFGTKAIENLKQLANRYEVIDCSTLLFVWEATSEYPKTTVVATYEGEHDWYRALLISDISIKFHHQQEARTHDYYLEMEDDTKD